MNKIIEDYKKIVAGNEAGKNICFMSRGEYADPKIAYNGILMNYWDVYDCMDEVEEPTDDDWLNAVSNLFDSYTYDVKNTDVDKFKMSWAALPVGPACIGKTCGGKRGVRSCSLDWLGRQIIYKHIRRYEY